MNAFGSFLKSLVSPLVSLVLLPWLQTKVLRTAEDKNRFELIAAISGEAADVLVQAYPGDDIPALIDRVVDDVSDAVPTTNRTVIYRAATAAVRRAIDAYRMPTAPPTP